MLRLPDYEEAVSRPLSPPPYDLLQSETTLPEQQVDFTSTQNLLSSEEQTNQEYSTVVVETDSPEVHEELTSDRIMPSRQNDLILFDQISDSSHGMQFDNLDPNDR